jgi:hypothetical protein
MIQHAEQIFISRFRLGVPKQQKIVDGVTVITGRVEKA